MAALERCLLRMALAGWNIGFWLRDEISTPTHRGDGLLYLPGLSLATPQYSCRIKWQAIYNTSVRPDRLPPHPLHPLLHLSCLRPGDWPWVFGWLSKSSSGWSTLVFLFFFSFFLFTLFVSALAAVGYEIYFTYVLTFYLKRLNILAFQFQKMNGIQMTLLDVHLNFTYCCHRCPRNSRKKLPGQKHTVSQPDFTHMYLLLIYFNSSGEMLFFLERNPRSIPNHCP